MARDRKRAKQRQRRAAGRPAKPGPGNSGDATPEERDETAPEEVAEASGLAPEEGEPELEDHEIEDLKHTSAGADIARDSIVVGAAGGGDGDGPSEEEAKEEIRFEKEREKAGSGPIAFLRNSWAELRRVQWPDRRQTFQGTMVTLVFVVIAGFYLGALDFVWQEFIDFIL